ncbi:hypothetical protein AADG42_14175 [Ammonicoccus fulvus]|uniref:ABC transporter permease n=1 Tax=Ammonicoccus fulvus TaxID=3138240 RepID=A0ABZ3FQQ8_9ACTN
MITLVAPELERYLTRRPTWIGAVVAVVVWGAISLMLGVEALDARYPVGLAAYGPGLIIVATAVVGAWGYFTAASAIGSEQASGALGTWLTFNPTRGRVYATKLIAVTVPTLVLALVATTLATGWALILSDRQEPGELGDLMLMAVRGVLVAGSFAVLGFVFALIGRSTLSALGVLVGWLVLVAMQAFFALALGHGWEWVGLERVIGEFLFNNESWVSHGLGIDYAVVVANGFLWFGLVAALVAVAAAVFARRDLH